jgi:mTERF domain-containing protein
MKFLKENGFLKRDLSYYTVAQLTEKVFVEKYISRHKEAAPHLAEDYANACRGEVPARFMFA